MRVMTYGSGRRRLIHSLPLLREVEAALHCIQTARTSVSTGMDMGFNQAGISQLFRHVGGYWMTVEPTPARCNLVATALGAERVLCAGKAGELPFEDKQFDVVVVARERARTQEELQHLMRECHRVLKTGGMFLVTVRCQRQSLLNAVWSPVPQVQPEASYTAAQIFTLLREGFDVLRFHYSCRFWVEAVDRWLMRRRCTGVQRCGRLWQQLLYGLALLADFPLVWSRGHQMTICARRKGWRAAPVSALGTRVPVSNAVLFDTRREKSRPFFIKFK